jgi:hypothetical protein
MAGMYPDDQTLQIFGETVKFPRLKNGKFTNGDFTNPLVKPSFIPAESINLILDNLENLIAASGLEPDNTSVEQLKEAIYAYVENEFAELLDETSEELDTLKELAEALGNDPNFSTTILNALATKAPLASPALTDIPTAPTAVPGTSTTQIATTEFVQQAIPSGVTVPINYCYVQYPSVAANDYNAAFPLGERPATLFGGTWTVQWEDTSYAFWRSGGSLAAESDRNNGLQTGAIQNITGEWKGTLGHVAAASSQAPLFRNGDPNVLVSGAFSAGTARTGVGLAGTSSSGACNALAFNAANVVPTASENRPINRRMIIWKRTA